MSNMFFVRCAILFAGFLLLTSSCNKDVTVKSSHSDQLTFSRFSVMGDFPLVKEGQVPLILADSTDAEVVTVAANALAGDIADITDVRPVVSHNLGQRPSKAIIVGTVGKSTLLDQIIDNGKFNADSIRGKWGNV